MQTKISILFYIKRAKPTTDGQVPIYMRVTVNGQRIESSTKRYIEASKWNPAAGNMKGNTDDSKSINMYLDMLRKQAYEYQTELIQHGQLVSADNMRNKILGVEEKQRSFIKIFEDHNNKIVELLNREYAPGTLQRYKTTLKHTKDFLKWKYNVSDIDVRKIDLPLITELEFYLRSVRKCANNSAVKYIKNFGKVVRICLSNGWIDKDPFLNYKSKTKEVIRIFLTQEDLDKIISKVFSNKRLKQVRNIFIFCCYTGLAYIDVKKLKRSDLIRGIDGELWIHIARQKTGTMAKIPVLPVAEDIINEYIDDQECIIKGLVLPVLSNQKMNAYLKEIADLCDIDKDLTMHTARQ